MIRLIKLIKKLYAEKTNLRIEQKDYHIKGWRKFNAWIDQILTCDRLTAQEKEYILSRVFYHVKRRRSRSFWNGNPVQISSMWIWSDVDRKRGVEKADSLGL